MSLSIFAYAQGTGMSENAMRGMDISSYEALKNAGVKYYDNDGNEESLLKVLHDNGVNYIRIRIWNDPFNKDGETYGGGGNDGKPTRMMRQRCAITFISLQKKQFRSLKKQVQMLEWHRLEMN